MFKSSANRLCNKKQPHWAYLYDATVHVSWLMSPAIYWTWMSLQLVLLLDFVTPKAANELLDRRPPPYSRQGQPGQSRQGPHGAAAILLRGREPVGGGPGRGAGRPTYRQPLPGGRPSAGRHSVPARPDPRLPVCILLCGQRHQHSAVVRRQPPRLRSVPWTK